MRLRKPWTGGWKGGEQEDEGEEDKAGTCDCLNDVMEGERRRRQGRNMRFSDPFHGVGEEMENEKMRVKTRRRRRRC